MVGEKRSTRVNSSMLADVSLKGYNVNCCLARLIRAWFNAAKCQNRQGTLQANNHNVNNSGYKTLFKKMFYEEEKAFSAFVRAQGCTQCILLSNTECEHSTPFSYLSFEVIYL